MSYNDDEEYDYLQEKNETDSDKKTDDKNDNESDESEKNETDIVGNRKYSDKERNMIEEWLKKNKPQVSEE